MTHKPLFREEDLQNKVDAKILEILNSIRQVSSMYVEPDDTIVVTVSQDMEDQDINRLQQIFKSLFRDNKGIFLTEGIEVKIIKKGESYEKEEISEIKKLKDEVEELKEAIKNIRSDPRPEHG